ncbi:response regulator receiver domain-containing protein [Stella humosa]|uniref:Response regulator receiver domain-containing protein n=1 Tax=Stella humosa TaxID=94 RepID=A0A3N1KN69_9PROT|nr:response regulator [Stella humosa]ROP80797.1 response regulator receiver domain-containing protein [Stella humosa]BBK33416.1 hypothetical protein STHU_40500 [Stella humosa]
MTKRALIVDDSKLARMAAAKALRAVRPDWERVEATDADQALEVVKTSRVDIALVDFNMPGRDGLQLAADLRASFPELPIALISANAQIEIVSRAREIGAVFLPKPLTVDTLAVFLDALPGAS